MYQKRHTLDSLPDVERSRSENITPRDIVVIEHLTFDEDLGVSPRSHPQSNITCISVPSGEIVLLLVLNSHFIQVIPVGCDGGSGGGSSLGGTIASAFGTVSRARELTQR